MNARIILIISIQLIFLNLNSQDLIESLGGVKTIFQFTSDTVDLQVHDQCILLRATSENKEDTYNGTGWAYGYQSYHLEFVTQRKLTTRLQKLKFGQMPHQKIELVLYDSNNKVLKKYTSEKLSIYTMYDADYYSLNTLK